jgi:hypothetical protein
MNYTELEGPFLIERLAAVSGRPLVVAEPGSSLALDVAEPVSSPALAVAEEEGSRLFVSAGFGTGRTALGPWLLPVDEENSFEKMTPYPCSSKRRRKVRVLEEVGKEKDDNVPSILRLYGSFHLITSQ